MEQRIYNYILFSLVDVTKTNHLHNSTSNELARDQHRNYQTMIQTLGLRTQPHINEKPEIYEVDNIKHGQYKFGETYQGKHKVWQLSFNVEYPDAFMDKDNNSIGLLEEDFDQVPVVSMLNETARFILPCFFSYGPLKNIYFKKVKPSYGSIRGH